MMNQQTIPKKQINESGSGYATDYFETVPQMPTEQVIYTTPATTKQEKRESFVFNFAKGSTPMAISRWDKESKSADSDKKSGKASEKEENMSLSEIVADMNKKNPFLKTPMKRRREEKEEPEPEGMKRMSSFKERAKKVTIPTEQVSTLKPEHIFMESGPLIVHVCYECRKYNATRPALDLGDGKVQLPLALCTVCRAHFNHQRTIKFFEHELPAIKKTYNL